jgi:hypothetical protein
MSEKAWVLVDASFRPLEVFKRQSEAIRAFTTYPSMMELVEMDRAEAVGMIRHDLFIKQKARCIACNKIVTEEQAHMHERVHRGQGGNISIDNSEILCSTCHIGPDGAHGNRRPQFGGE